MRLGETVALLKSEVKSQEKHVEALKKKSLWSRTLEEVFVFLELVTFFGDFNFELYNQVSLEGILTVFS